MLPRLAAEGKERLNANDWGKERDMRIQRLVGEIVLGVLLIAQVGFSSLAFHASGPAQKSGYSRSMKELRHRFNADKGKVRLFMLLSPT